MTYKLSQNIDKVIQKLKSFYILKEEHIYFSVLNEAQVTVNEECTHDNWNCGQTGHDLHLTIPFKLFCDIVETKTDYQNKLTVDINKFHGYNGNNNGPNEWIENVFIDSLPNDENEILVEPDAVRRIWDEGFVRAFISHRDMYKKEVSELAAALKINGISGFVAHESIQPSKEWEIEIENALRSMDVFIIYHKPGFHDSSYCDQEVGFALAKNVPILTLWHDPQYPPKGFITKVQALKVLNDSAYSIVQKLIDLLRKEPELASKHDTALILSLCSSDSFNMTRGLIPQVDKYCSLNDQKIEQLINAYNTNDQINGYSGRVQAAFWEKVMKMHSVKRYRWGIPAVTIEEER